MKKTVIRELIGKIKTLVLGRDRLYILCIIHRWGGIADGTVMSKKIGEERHWAEKATNIELMQF